MSIRQRALTFPQMIGMLGLAGIGSNADRLFGGLNSFDELTDSVVKCGGFHEFCKQRGVYSEDLIFMAYCAMQDVAAASMALSCSMRGVGLHELKICITGAVSVNGERMTKAVFVDRCNELCRDSNGTQLLEVKNSSAKNTATFIVYTTTEMVDKYRTGLARGVETDALGAHDVLISASEFYNWLKGVMSEWNTSLSSKISHPQGSVTESLLSIMRKTLPVSRE